MFSKVEKLCWDSIKEKMPTEPKATAERITLYGEKRARVVYMGPKGGKYVKKDGKFVTIAKQKQNGGTAPRRIFDFRLGDEQVLYLTAVEIPHIMGTRKSVPVYRVIAKEPINPNLHVDPHSSSYRFYRDIGVGDLFTYENEVYNKFNIMDMYDPSTHHRILFPLSAQQEVYLTAVVVPNRMGTRSKYPVYRVIAKEPINPNLHVDPHSSSYRFYRDIGVGDLFTRDEMGYYEVYDPNPRHSYKYLHP